MSQFFQKIVIVYWLLSSLKVFFALWSLLFRGKNVKIVQWCVKQTNFSLCQRTTFFKSPALTVVNFCTICTDNISQGRLLPTTEGGSYSAKIRLSPSTTLFRQSNLIYRVSHREKCIVNQLWGVGVLLNDGPKWLEKAINFEFHESVFKKLTSVGLNSL